MFFFIFFDISSLLLRYITPAIPRSSRLDLSKNILKNIDSYLNFRTLVLFTTPSEKLRPYIPGIGEGDQNGNLDLKNVPIPVAGHKANGLLP